MISVTLLDFFLLNYLSPQGCNLRPTRREKSMEKLKCNNVVVNRLLVLNILQFTFSFILVSLRNLSHDVCWLIDNLLKKWRRLCSEDLPPSWRIRCNVHCSPVSPASIWSTLIGGREMWDQGHGANARTGRDGESCTGVSQCDLSRIII